MNVGAFEIFENKIIIKIKNRVCETADEVLTSSLFKEVIKRGVQELLKRNSMLLGIFPKPAVDKKEIETLIQALQFLAKMPGHLVPNVVKGADSFLKDPGLFNQFVEFLYNYWRSYDRFIVCDSGADDLDRRPARTFNATVEQLTHLIRGTYRDIQENITGKTLRTYRQVTAGAEIATISQPLEIPYPADHDYRKLEKIPVIRQILMYPPLILNPPTNKRTGQFERIEQNPLGLVKINKDEWLCFPAKVGPLIILVYFHEKFFELGFALCNLFEVATDHDLKRRPDAVYLYGVPGEGLDRLAAFPTVFYDDQENHLLVATVPNRDEFGYFGYLKKMILTLHNVRVMQQGRMPFHGALVKIMMKSGKEATVLIMGDTGAGKSETLEAFRTLGKNDIRDLVVIADDMGSLEETETGLLVGYGTETGAFLRLDDLQPGYAFGQMDRAIIMSPNKVNARIVLPVTTFETLIQGHRLDYVLYANNYDEVDENHPILERFNDADQALNVFREGRVMSKGTTTSTGIVHSYFANIFGPPQYRETHEHIARQFFKKFFEKGLFVGQLRTRLGIPGWERKGPEEAAKVLLESLR